MAAENGFRDTRAQDQIMSVLRPQQMWWRAPRTWVIAAAVLAALLLARPLWRFMAAEQSISRASLRFASVEMGAIVSEASAYGRVVAAQAPTLYATTAGTVIFKVEAGAQVGSGEVLADVDSPELRNRLQQEQQALESAQSEADRQRVANRRAELAKARELEAARNVQTAAEREWQRAERAFELQAMSKVDHLRAGDALQAARIAFEFAERDLLLEKDALALELRNRQSLVQRQRLAVDEVQRQVAALAITAPFDGVVGTRLVADRSNVAANTGVLSVVDLTQLELEVPVAEIYAGKLVAGLPVQLEHNQQRYPGVVRTVSPEIVAGQFLLRVAFSEAQPPDLKQSQRVLARVQLERTEQTLTVQRGGFIDADGGRYAWKVSGDELVRTPITLGALAADRVEIVSGLQAGDQIVISAINESDVRDANRLLLLR